MHFAKALPSLAPDLRSSALALCLVAAGAVAAGCGDVTEERLAARSSATETEEKPGAEKPGVVVTTDACTAACADTSTRSNAAICYSCRCKDALGDLPTPEELRCSTGDAIKTFRLEEGAEVEITG